MKKTKLLLAAAAIMMLAVALNSCSKDEATPDSPKVSAPASTTTVSINASSDISFEVTTPGGFKSATTSAAGGTSVVKTQPSPGAASGTVVVTFTAGAAVTAGAVNIEVTDNNNKSNTATAVVAVALKAPIEISSAITASTTWVATEKYLLKGNIYVASGAELTIPAGTVILGDKVTKGALIISRGAKIHAVGTAAKPIIFTSSSPKGSRNIGDWGGVVILGKAQNNQSASQPIEGISAPTGDNGLYGGTTDDDNSGEFQYVRIEFAGIALSTDNELNGLTMGSVGSATKIDHIQVSYSGDDSYEWFGGKVNTTYLIAYRGWDDEFDTDFGYSGFNQFLVSFRDPNLADKSGSNGFESDNNAQGDNKTPQTQATFSNVTFFGPFMYANLSSGGALQNGTVSLNYGRGAHIRRGSGLKVYNTVFAGSSLVGGVQFEKASATAVFKGNYIGRIATGYAKSTTVNDFAGGTTYDDSNFAADNTIEATLSSVDLNSKFAGASIKSPVSATTAHLWDINQPSALLAVGSPLLTGAVSVPNLPSTAGFNASVTYRGAFDAANNWATASWTNYDPNNAEY